MFDLIYKGNGYGDVADRLLEADGDVNVLRPWKDARGRSCQAFFNNRTKKLETMFVNAPSTLSRDQWVQMDEVVVRAALPALKVWGDIRGSGLTYNVPNGMGVTVIQHQTITEAGEATLSMDGLRETNRDRPLTDLANLPLPIVHSDFSFSLREILASRRSSLPLDVGGIENATKRCIETIEKLTIGSLSSYSYGGGTVYGLTNFPDRLTKVLTLPTAAGWTPSTMVDEVLDMVQSAQDIFFNGPYACWVSPSWTKYLDGDYASTYGGKTLRQRLNDISDIKFIHKADYLSGYQVVLTELSSFVVQAVTGMKLQTLQWESNGGLKKNFKVMGIMVPRIRSNSNGDTGIVHGVAA